MTIMQSALNRIDNKRKGKTREKNLLKTKKQRQRRTEPVNGACRTRYPIQSALLKDRPLLPNRGRKCRTKKSLVPSRKLPSHPGELHHTASSAAYSPNKRAET